jgi:hypothetical protein
MNSQPILLNKMPPGTFIELDDLLEGRKISLVCDDGITSIDNMCIGSCTPYLIHKKFNPILLGTISQYVEEHNLNDVYSKLLSFLVRKGFENEASDALLIMRSLHYINNSGLDEATLPLIDSAVERSIEQQKMLDDLHKYIIDYLKSSSENAMSRRD